MKSNDSRTMQFIKISSASFAVVIAFLLPLAAVARTCVVDRSLVDENGRIYEKRIDAKNWDAAKETAASYARPDCSGGPGRLATIANEAEFRTIRNACNADNESEGRCWIGLRWYVSGGFRWVGRGNNTPVDYSFELDEWFPGNPLGDGDCVEMYFNDGMNDRPCSDKLPYIVEFDNCNVDGNNNTQVQGGTEVDETLCASSPRVVDRTPVHETAVFTQPSLVDFSRLYVTGSIYEKHSTKLDWKSARDAAASFNRPGCPYPGHLVTISDTTEDSVIQNLCSASNDPEPRCWIGLQRDLSGRRPNDDDENWRWVTGERNVFLDWSDES